MPNDVVNKYIIEYDRCAISGVEVHSKLVAYIIDNPYDLEDVLAVLQGSPDSHLHFIGEMVRNSFKDTQEPHSDDQNNRALQPGDSDGNGAQI